MIVLQGTKRPVRTTKMVRMSSSTTIEHVSCIRRSREHTDTPIISILPILPASCARRAGRENSLCLSNCARLGQSA